MPDTASRFRALAPTMAERRQWRTDWEARRPPRHVLDGLVTEGPVERMVEDRKGNQSIITASYYYSKRGGHLRAIDHGEGQIEVVGQEVRVPSFSVKPDGFIRRWPRGRKPKR